MIIIDDSYEVDDDDGVLELTRNLRSMSVLGNSSKDFRDFLGQLTQLIHQDLASAKSCGESLARDFRYHSEDAERALLGPSEAFYEPLSPTFLQLQSRLEDPNVLGDLIGETPLESGYDNRDCYCNKLIVDVKRLLTSLEKAIVVFNNAKSLPLENFCELQGYCPMAGAEWFSSSFSDIQNSYRDDLVPSLSSLVCDAVCGHSLRQHHISKMKIVHRGHAARKARTERTILARRLDIERFLFSGHRSWM